MRELQESFLTVLSKIFKWKIIMRLKEKTRLQIEKRAGSVLAETGL